MTIRVARLPYVSSEPFYFDMERRGIAMVPMAPSMISSAADAGEIDAGPVPVADFARWADRFRTLSGFCIASVTQVGSVFLHSTKPIEELAGSRIGVTNDSSSAFKLLQVLFALKYHVEPQAYVSLDEPCDALLHIGNLGLRNRGGVRGFAHNYDLGNEWHQWTGLPLVLARWMVRKDLGSADVALLEDSIYIFPTLGTACGCTPRTSCSMLRAFGTSLECPNRSPSTCSRSTWNSLPPSPPAPYVLKYLAGVVGPGRI